MGLSCLDSSCAKPHFFFVIELQFRYSRENVSFHLFSGSGVNGKIR